MFEEVTHELLDSSIAILESYYIFKVCDSRLLQSLVAKSTKEFPIPGWIKRIRTNREDKAHQLLITQKLDEPGLFERILQFYSIQPDDISIVELPTNPPPSRKIFNDWSRLYWPMSYRKITEEVVPVDLTFLSTLTPFSSCTKSRSIIASPDGDIILSAASNTESHPLKHEIMVCIDEISRIRSIGPVSVDNYLCKGLDLYTWREPCVMCGMALVHSRVARVFIRERRAVGGAFGSPYGIQSRKGLNHHYKVYHWKEENKIEE